MIQGGDQEEIVRKGSGRVIGFEKPVSGVSFSLRPVSSGARFPVHVYLDGATNDPVVVSSCDWQGETPFNSLRVDVGPGGGQEGDTWKLWTAPTAADTTRTRLRTDARGRVELARLPAAVAWEASQIWQEYDADYEAGTRRAYLKPRDGEEAAAQLVLADSIPTNRSAYTWNMEGRERAAFTLDVPEGGFSQIAGAMKMVAELCAAPDQRPYATVEIASVWEGNDDVNGATFAILLGAKTAQSSARLEAVTDTAPFVRFYFDAPFGLFLDVDGDAKHMPVALTLW